MTQLAVKGCNKCAELKHYTQFNRDRTKKDGHSTVCKDCQKKQKATRKEEAKKVRKRHYELTKEKSSAYHKEKNSLPEVKQRRKEHHLKRTYGLDLEKLEKLKAKQKFLCAICNTHEAECTKQILFVDHNHKTGKVRGLLCSQCNAALGLFYDDISLLQSAISYLVNND